MSAYSNLLERGVPLPLKTTLTSGSCTFAGVWNKMVTYMAGDIVFSTTGLTPAVYICVQDVVGSTTNTFPNTTYWKQVVA